MTELRSAAKPKAALDAFWIKCGGNVDKARDALRVLIQQARDQRHMAFLFVNNRLEGNAIATISAMMQRG